MTILVAAQVHLDGHAAEMQCVCVCVCVVKEFFHVRGFQILNDVFKHVYFISYIFEHEHEELEIKNGGSGCLLLAVCLRRR